MVISILDLTGVKKIWTTLSRHGMSAEVVSIVRQEAILNPIKGNKIAVSHSIKSVKGFVKSRMHPGPICRRDPCNDRLGFYIFIKPALLKIPVCDSVPEALN